MTAYNVSYRVVFGACNTRAQDNGSPSRSGGSTRTIRDDLKRCAESPLGSGNLRLAVRLPEGEMVEEWIASNSTNGATEAKCTNRIVNSLCSMASACAWNGLGSMESGCGRG